MGANSVTSSNFGDVNPTETHENISPSTGSSGTTQSELDIIAENAVNAEVEAVIGSYGSTPYCHHKIPKRRFYSDDPNTTTFYIQPGYDFFRNNAGIVDPGISFDQLDTGNYQVTGQGPMTGWSPGPELSFGFDFRRYAPYQNHKHPHKKLFEQKGPRFSLQASFGHYDLDHYGFTGEASTDQIEEKWGITESQLQNAGWQAANGDFGGLFGLFEMIPSIWGNYDFADDFYGETVVTDQDVPYFRTSGTFWMGSSVYNASTPINVLESAHFGVSGNLMTLGGNPYLGMGLAAESSILRISPPIKNHHLRGDLLLTASASYYRGIDPSDFGNDGFWTDSHFVEAQTGVSFRVTTDIPSGKSVVHAAKTGAKIIEDGAQNYYESGGFEMEMWDAAETSTQN